MGLLIEEFLRITKFIESLVIGLWIFKILVKSIVIGVKTFKIHSKSYWFFLQIIDLSILLKFIVIRMQIFFTFTHKIQFWKYHVYPQDF